MNQGVSVIVPNYNLSKFLPEAIESIVAQTYRPLEIVVVDDCSTDESPDILRAYEQKDWGEGVTFHAVLLPKNGMVSHARNVGAENASYDYICFMDSDDRFYNPKKIENEMNLVMKYAEKGEDIVAYSRIVYMDYDGNVFGNQGTNPKRYMEGDVKYYLISGFKAARLPRDYVFKKSIFFDVKGYPEGFYEDFDILLKLSFKCRFFCTQEWGTVYRRFPDGISHKPYKEHLKVRRGMCRKYFKTLKPAQKLKCSFYFCLRAMRNFVRILKGEKVR